MGEVDDPSAEFPDFTLTARERDWVESLRGLDPETRAAMLHITKALIAPR